MFEQATVVSARAPKRIWQSCVGFLGQALLLGGAMLVPILSPQILPKAMLSSVLLTPGAPPPPPPQGELAIRPKPVRSARVFTAGLVAPSMIPKGTPRIVEEPDAPPSIGVPGGVAGGARDGVPGGVLDSILSAGTPVVPPRIAPVKHDEEPKAPPPAAPPRIRVGGGVRMAETVYRPDPAYPVLAKQMRVSGTVELQGVIGVDGRLKELRVVAGHPLLAKAALEAVSQWVYKPTLLNGTPVEVIAPITVTFRLN